MKKNFRGYYPITEEEIIDIWKKGFISVDTNVLFNLYRYSDETRTELLKIIKKYSKQIFLSHHSAYEFHKNRINVISEQIAIYDDTIKAFNKLENDIVKNLKTPHLSKETLDNFKNSLESIIKDLESKKTFFIELLRNDSILESISEIFTDSKVGNPFTKDEKIKIEKEGVERYQNKTPPGYKDNDKKTNKYGDLIIWKELLKESKEKKIPFIFILDDVKKDWWLRINGQTLSPRPELLQEAFEETEQLFHLYTTDRFLEFAGQSEEIMKETIEEVREINNWQNSKLNNKSFQEILDNTERWKKSVDYVKLLNSLTHFKDINDRLSKQMSFKFDENITKMYIKKYLDQNDKDQNDGEDGEETFEEV